MLFLFQCLLVGNRILPENTNPKRRKIAESVIVNEHIDRQIGLILLPDGKKLLVVNPTYYSVYKENIFQLEAGIDEIAKKMAVRFLCLMMKTRRI